MVVATGFFDGVHSGHRQVIDKLVSVAASRHTDSVVVTFRSHPRHVLDPDGGKIHLLTSLKEKTDILKRLGVHNVEVLEFNESFSRLSAEEYLRDYVVGKYCADAMVMGYDNSLGCDRLGPDDVRLLGEKYGVEVVVVERMDSEGLAVSSTRIREALEKGEVDAAASMLGYSYQLTGTVVHGQHLGRTIGFPTANLSPDEPEKLLPGRGAYRVEVQVRGEWHKGMCNIGVKPTLGGFDTPEIEAHLFDFDDDIYDENITISFLEKIRDEKRFSGIEELKKQLEKDKNLCIFETEWKI